LIAQVIFSLYRLLGADQFVELVFVDNASTDGVARASRRARADAKR
jgi:hypothetical protein